MIPAAYYNEHDPFAAAWLRELIKDDLIAPGEVDERSIEDVTPNDLRPFRQCHFFAGIGVWSLATRQAGISDDTPLWTGSAPCQPFSQAGERAGFTDERHLWPAYHYLIEQCRPALVTGEQVAGSGGDLWLDLVSADMDATGYAFGAVETCAAGFGAPHIRARNYWVAYALGQRIRDTISRSDGKAAERAARKPRQQWLWHDTGNDMRFDPVDVADAYGKGWEWRGSRGPIPIIGEVVRPFRRGDDGPTRGLWQNAEWIYGRDEKWRPTQPDTFPLVDAGAFRNRRSLLRGAGNAITLGQAEAFLRAVVASLP